MLISDDLLKGWGLFVGKIFYTHFQCVELRTHALVIHDIKMFRRQKAIHTFKRSSLINTHRFLLKLLHYLQTVCALGSFLVCLWHVLRKKSGYIRLVKPILQLFCLFPLINCIGMALVTQHVIHTRL